MHRPILCITFCSAVIASLFSASAVAFEPPTTTKSPTTSTQPADSPVTTEHEITLAGDAIKYKVAAGMVTLKDDAGKARGKIFHVAYEKQLANEADRANRPITFIFNGGPGAASIWLHLGTAGPMRVVLPDDGRPPATPYRLAENPQSWLSFTDMVFIDPVGTGYSRAEEDKGREFYGVRGDIDSVADFIRIYLTKNQRWLSPKFLAGESYGTTRAAGLSGTLHDRYGIDLDGIVLISTVMNFQTLDFSAGNDTGYPLFLPTYAAIAHHHKKLPPDLQRDLKKTVEDATNFAINEYMPALARGSSLDDASFDRVSQQLARFSGLTVDYVVKSKLRVSPFRFEKALLADQQRVIGRMDGRFSGHDSDPINDTPDFDPTLTGYVGVFSSTFNDYARRTLKFEDEGNYEFLSPRVSGWDFGPAGRGYLNVSTTLRDAMTKVPSMRILLCSGYYDLATPFTAADHTVNQMPLSKELRANISHKLFEGGHMFYLNVKALEELNKEMKSFYDPAR